MRTLCFQSLQADDCALPNDPLCIWDPEAKRTGEFGETTTGKCVKLSDRTIQIPTHGGMGNFCGSVSVVNAENLKKNKAVKIQF